MALRVLLVAAAVLAVGGLAYMGLSVIRQDPGSQQLEQNLATAVDPEGQVQVSEGGGVSIQTSFDPAAAARAGAATFRLTLNTHSVELGGLDLAGLSSVYLEPGGLMSGATWIPEGDGDGHHLVGLLTVPDPGGLLAAARTIMLEVRNVAGVPVRTFQWQGAVR